MVGNDPRAALLKMKNSGMVVNLPNGKTLSIDDAIAMAEGKTAMQFLTELTS